MLGQVGSVTVGLTRVTPVVPQQKVWDQAIADEDAMYVKVKDLTKQMSRLLDQMDCLKDPERCGHPSVESDGHTYYDAVERPLVELEGAWQALYGEASRVHVGHRKTVEQLQSIQPALLAHIEALNKDVEALQKRQELGQKVAEEDAKRAQESKELVKQLISAVISCLALSAIGSSGGVVGLGAVPIITACVFAGGPSLLKADIRQNFSPAISRIASGIIDLFPYGLLGYMMGATSVSQGACQLLGAVGLTSVMSRSSVQASIRKMVGDGLGKDAMDVLLRSVATVVGVTMGHQFGKGVDLGNSGKGMVVNGPQSIWATSRSEQSDFALQAWHYVSQVGANVGAVWGTSAFKTGVAVGSGLRLLPGAGAVPMGESGLGSGSELSVGSAEEVSGMGAIQGVLLGRTDAVAQAIFEAIPELIRPETLAEVTGDMLASIDELTVDVGDARTLQVQDFEGLVGLDKLSLSAHALESLSLGVFQDITGIRTFEFYSDNLPVYPSGFLQIFTQLETLKLSNELGDYTQFSDDFFYGLSQLKNLQILKNGLTNISSEAFRDLYQLQYLEVGNTALTRLPEGLFNGLDQLDHITFSANSNLVEFPAQLCQNLPLLKTFSLIPLTGSAVRAILPKDFFLGSFGLKRMDFIIFSGQCPRYVLSSLILNRGFLQVDEGVRFVVGEGSYLWRDIRNLFNLESFSSYSDRVRVDDQFSFPPESSMTAVQKSFLQDLLLEMVQFYIHREEGTLVSYDHLSWFLDHLYAYVSDHGEQAVTQQVIQDILVESLARETDPNYRAPFLISTPILTSSESSLFKTSSVVEGRVSETVMPTVVSDSGVVKEGGVDAGVVGGVTAVGAVGGLGIILSLLGVVMARRKKKAKLEDRFVELSPISSSVSLASQVTQVTQVMVEETKVDEDRCNLFNESDPQACSERDL